MNLTHVRVKMGNGHGIAIAEVMSLDADDGSPPVSRTNRDVGGALPEEGAGRREDLHERGEPGEGKADRRF
ncbi:MAG: hypothetical protein FJ405_01275 [Verrucomicrobia bacterium]|nr:hypothetical protein [Verrucomicrobiota bacterium]